MSAKRSRFIFMALVVIASLSSCSIMKRHYTRGFYVSSKGEASAQVAPRPAKQKRDARKPSVIEKVTTELAKITHLPERKTVTAKQQLIASSKKDIAPVKESSLGCDTLYLRDGTIIAARVLEISYGQVTFRYCAGADKTQKTIAKKDIDHITYANGTKEKFDTTSKPNSTDRNGYDLPVNGFALAGFILSLLFYPALLLAVFAIWGAGTITGAFAIVIAVGLIYLLGLIFSIVGIVQISNNRDRYRGLALAIIGLIISLIPIILAVAGLF